MRTKRKHFKWSKGNGNRNKKIQNKNFNTKLLVYSLKWKALENLGRRV